MQLSNQQHRWISKITFWQLNLALGFSMMALFTFGFVASHALMYQFQHSLNILAQRIGLDSKFELFGLLLTLTSLILYLALHNGKLVAKLNISRVSIYAILMANALILSYLIYLVLPHSTLIYQQLSAIGLIGWLGAMIRVCLTVATVSLIAGLLWHHLIKMRPRLKSMMVTLLQPLHSEKNQAKSNTGGKAIAIFMLIGLLLIVFNLFKLEITRYIHIEKKLYSVNHDVINKTSTINNEALYCERLHDLGNLLIEAKRYDEAENIFRRALTIAENSTMPNNLIKTNAILDLAKLSSLIGNQEEARILYSRVKVFVKTN